jgi:hypothetical protein
VLPHPSKYDVYVNFIHNLREKGLIRYSCHYSYFNKVWNKHFTSLKLRRISGFTHCDFCENKKEIIASSLDSDLRKITKHQLHKHREFIRKERNVYYVKRATARLDPSSAVSLIIDGSDMANYGLPHFAIRTKETVVGYKMLMKLVGVIIHGIGAYVFIVHKNWAADPNLTIEILHRVLNVIQPQQAKTLYIQV